MKRVCMALIRFYQRHISPRKACPTCRFTPTCSSYALQAFETRGFFAGMILSVWRILRCNPWAPYGYDPVPEKGFRTMPMRWSKYDRTARPTPQTADDPPSTEATDTADTADTVGEADVSPDPTVPSEPGDGD